MIKLYGFSETARMFITILLGMAVLFQTLAMIFNYYSKRSNRINSFKNLLELSILLEILVFSLLHGQVINGYRYSFLISGGYDKFRIIVFILILSLVAVISIWEGSFRLVIIIPAAMISLPVMEKILGSAYPVCFIVVLFFFLGRSIIICVRSIRIIRTKISALSITHAIDTLHTGVLLSESDGHILLCNEQMQDLMQTFTGRMYRNAIQFYDRLVSDHNEFKIELNKLDQQIVYQGSDGTKWMLTKTDIYSDGKKYLQLSLSDVTEFWRLTDKLQAKNQELRRKSDELKATMDNLHRLSHHKELEQAKMRAHDILGQRLSVLLRIIQNEKELDLELLTALSKDLLAELKAEQKERSPEEELINIQQVFHAIGVDINFVGQLPKNLKLARLLVEVIREASTNAVRHGFATEINIQVNRNENNYDLIIKNNGDVLNEPITPGSGLRLMKKKVAAQGGTLNILQKPVFTLLITIPGGETDA